MKEGIVLEIQELTATILSKEGDFLAIPASANWQVGDKVRFNEIAQKGVHKARRTKKQLASFISKKNITIALVASLLILMIPLAFSTGATTFVTLDINPSIELEVKDSTVIKAKPLNKDGEMLLAQITNKRQALNDFTGNLLDKAKELGYLQIDGESVIMIGILDDKGSFEKEKYGEYVQSKLLEVSLQTEVLVLEATKLEKKEADDKGVSLGKYLLQKNSEQEGITISDKKLKEESVKELVDNIKLEKEKLAKDLPKADDKKNNDKEKDKNNNNTTSEIETDLEKDKEAKKDSVGNNQGAVKSNSNANTGSSDKEKGEGPKVNPNKNAGNQQDATETGVDNKATNNGVKGNGNNSK